MANPKLNLNLRLVEEAIRLAPCDSVMGSLGD
jgi:hypothetical protein